MTARRGVLLVGPMSGGPIVGGIENGIDMILRSPLVTRHRIAFFNSYRGAKADRGLASRLVGEIVSYGRYVAALARLRPRLVHVKSADRTNFVQGVLYALIARLCGRHVLLQIHGGEFDAWYGGLSPLRRRGVRLALRAPSEVIALSEYWRDFVRRLVPSKPVHVVRNGVEVECAHSRPQRGDGTLRVITIGAIGVRKGHFDIVEAATLLRGRAVSFQFVGTDEYGGESAQLERLIDERGLRAQVEIVGALTGTAKWAALAAADVFLLPARNENMPNSILEAMAAGLPIVCTDVGAVRETVDAAGARFVPVAEPNAIARALAALLDDEDARRAMGAANRARAMREYAFEHVAGELDRLYSSGLSIGGRDVSCSMLEREARRGS